MLICPVMLYYISIANNIFGGKNGKCIIKTYLQDISGRRKSC